MKKIKSVLNLSFAIFIIYVLSCSRPVSSIQKEETLQPPPFLKKERNKSGNDSLRFTKSEAWQPTGAKQTITKRINFKKL